MVSKSSSIKSVGITVDSTKKVGEGVSGPVDKLGKLSSKASNVTSKANSVNPKQGMWVLD